MKFSERIGVVAPRTALQIRSMDGPLRTGLWNALTVDYFRYVANDNPRNVTYPRPPLKNLVGAMWLNYFKRPLDTLPPRWTDIHKELRDYFFTAQWYEVYEFVEFCAKRFELETTNEGFRRRCNAVMEEEKSGCRFVSGEIVEITSQDEIAAIEDGQSLSGRFGVVSDNLTAALLLLSDKREPDYRNSIKESISAVEGMCSILANQTKADLGTALKVLEKQKPMHGALKSAFLSLYGFTSDAGGIRHALLGDANLTFADAKFMLVACSAFVNYLKEFIED